MRYRSRGALVDNAATGSYSLCNGSSASYPSTHAWLKDQGRAGTLEEMWDETVSRFQTRSKRGEVFVNRMIRSRESEIVVSRGAYGASYKNSCSGTSTKAWAFQGGQINMLPHTAPVTLRSKDTVAESLASTSALANVAGPEVMGLVTIAEFEKTMEMMRTPLGNLRLFLQRVARRRGRIAKAKSLIDFISSEWLRYRYGIMPLVMEVQAAVKLLEDPTKPLRRTARGRQVVETKDSTYSDYSYGSSTTFGWKTRKTTTFNRVYSVRAGVLYQHKSDFSSNTGLRLSDIPSAAWELIPFSFVADWFVNLGDYIQAVTPKAGVEILATWQTRDMTLKYDVVASNVETWNNPSYTWVGTGKPEAHVIRTVESRTRSPGISASLALKARTIDFGQTLTQKRVIDAIALVNQQLRR